MLRAVLLLLAGLVVTTAASAQTLPADPALIEDLVAANRILYDQGVVDGFGHVSARHDKNPEHFLLARSMAPGLVTAADIMEFDRDGNAVDPQGRAVYTEVNARLEAEALRLGQGEVEFLNEQEAAKATATNAGVLSRAWDLWKAKALPAAR